MKIGICDDNEMEREQLKQHCVDAGYNDIVFFSSGEELLESTELTSLDLLFLDIEMDGMNGIEVKHTLEQLSPITQIAFCTTHEEMVYDAFGHNVVSFLRKPLSGHLVAHCLKRTAFLIKDFYPLAIDDETLVPYRNIVYLQSEQKYTIFHLKDGRTVSSRKTLKEWIKELEAYDFCAVSRSAVINLKYYIKTENKQVKLRGNISLPLSRRYIQPLTKAFNAYLLSLARND